MKRIDYTINVRVYVVDDADTTPRTDILNWKQKDYIVVENAVATGSWDVIKATVTEVE